jgi:thiol-disulfide isomerase/thioredoxin
MNKKYVGYLLLVLAIGIVLFQYVKFRVAPDFNVNDLTLVTKEGIAYPITFKEDKLLVVSFFTTWCGPCHQEFMEIQQAKLKKLLPHVEFIAVTDESLEKLNNYVTNYSYNYIDFVHYPDNIGNIGIHAFPTIYIYNSKGKLLYSKVGLVDWNDAKWLAQFKA